RAVEGGAAVIVQPVRDREWHPEEPLPADAPVLVEVLHPGPVPRSHVRRMPREFLAAAQKQISESQDRDEPLSARDDLEGSGTVLGETDGVAYRGRVADEGRD